MTEVATKSWYIVHTYSGFENKVKESLLQRVQAYGLQNEIGEVLIPTEDIVEKRGAVSNTRRDLSPQSGHGCGFSYSDIGRMAVNGPQFSQRYS